MSGDHSPGTGRGHALILTGGPLPLKLGPLPEADLVIAADNATPQADTRGTVAYKTHLAKELTIRSLRTAVARATGSTNGQSAGQES